MRNKLAKRLRKLFCSGVPGKTWDDQKAVDLPNRVNRQGTLARDSEAPRRRYRRAKKELVEGTWRN